MILEKVLIAYKKSISEIYGNSPDKEVQKFIQSSSVDVKDMRRSHESQKRTLEEVIKQVNIQRINHDVIYRADITDVSDYSLIVTVGGDGTFLDVSHYVIDIPMLGVNSDPSNSTGYYSYSNYNMIGEHLDTLYLLPVTRLNRLQLSLNNHKIKELVLNDVLITHSNPAANTRIKVYDGELVEKYRKCSGLLMCTANGSTAFMYEEGGPLMDLSSNKILYHIRSNKQQRDVFTEVDELKIESLTRQGRLYIDGEHLSYNFTLGDVIQITKGHPLTVVGNFEEKRKKYCES